MTIWVDVKCIRFHQRFDQTEVDWFQWEREKKWGREKFWERENGREVKGRDDGRKKKNHYLTHFKCLVYPLLHSFLFYIYIYIYHHLQPSAWISLTISHHPPYRPLLLVGLQDYICICTELLYVCLSWSSCLCSSMWRGPQEYITTSSAVSHMSGSSNFYLILLGEFLCSCC